MQWESLLLITTLAGVIILTCILSWGAYEYIRLRWWLAIVCNKAATLKMNCDEIIDQLIEQQNAPVVPTTSGAEKVDPAGTNLDWLQGVRPDNTWVRNA